MTAPMLTPTGPQPPQPPPPMTLQQPWTPFTPRPNDTEPEVAAIWRWKLSRLISSVNYGKFGPEWQDVLNQQYLRTRQALAVAGPPAEQGKPGGAMKAGNPAQGPSHLQGNAPSPQPSPHPGVS